MPRGFKNSLERSRKLSQKLKGKLPWNKGKEYLQIKGENNPNWKGGITPIHLKIRSSLKYKLWRKEVFERDHYTCIWCGISGNGKNLNADHIKRFADYPALRFTIDNGRTLCVDCHKKTETYGNRRLEVAMEPLICVR